MWMVLGNSGSSPSDTGGGSEGGGGVIAIVNCDRQPLSFRFYQNVKQVNSKIVVY